MAHAKFEVKFDAFSFTDLLALVLALFSVGLSVAFYFKANEASNIFYDNTYKFTKDMSEILGRIEAGFGERLRHIDENYSGMREKFDQLHAVHRKMDEKEEEIHDTEVNARKLLEKIAERANMGDAEKEQLFRQMNAAIAERDRAIAQLETLRRIERNSDSHTSAGRPINRASSWGRALARKIKRTAGDREFDLSTFQTVINTMLPSLPEAYRRDARRFGFLDEKDEINAEGATFVLEMMPHVVAD